MRRLAVFTALAFLGLPVGRSTPAAPQAGSPAAGVERQARALLDGGQAPAALELLKPAIAAQPSQPGLRWLLARAYLMAGNDFWALRTLADLGRLVPDRCEPQLWMAWIHLKQGALDSAAEALALAACPAGSPAETRRLLLAARYEQHAQRPAAARSHLDAARRAAQLYAEDAPALAQLTASLDPGALPLVTGKLELSGGGAANARAGSPLDPATGGAGAASPTGQLNLWLRLVAPTSQALRPTLEADLRSQGYSAAAGRELSYLMAGLRPGLLMGAGRPDLLLAYRFDAVLLAGGDRYQAGPLWFYNTHRAELELNLSPSLMLFGGAGQRLFRERGRSRTEVDGGLGGGALPHPRLRLMGAVTGRWQAAVKAAYDLWGATALLSAELRLPADWALRGGLLLALDQYPRSAGYFDAAAPAVTRRDALFKLLTSAWYSLPAQVKLGVAYEYAARCSTAGAYTYQDHRLLGRLAWSFSLDPLLPSAVTPPGHVPLDHGMAAADLDERLQDLLRQEEAAQRSSSCVE